MIGESTTGTADDAAAARDSGTALRSEQMTSNMPWLKTKREPVEMSVADARIIGPLPRLRSPKVAPLNRISSYSWAASSERPQPVDDSSPQYARAQRAGDDLALDVALQEALLVVVEQLVAIQAVGQRGEAAARHAGDDVDCVEQADLVALRPDDLGAPQELQHAVGKRGGARAAAREGEDDQVVLVFGLAPGASRNDSPCRVGLRDRRIDRAGGAAAQQDKKHGSEAVESVRGVHAFFFRMTKTTATRAITPYQSASVLTVSWITSR